MAFVRPIGVQNSWPPSTSGTPTVRFAGKNENERKENKISPEAIKPFASRKPRQGWKALLTALTLLTGSAAACAPVVGSPRFVRKVNRIAPTNVGISGFFASGSGTFFRDRQGSLYILTNNHVTQDNEMNIWDVIEGKAPKFDVHLYNGSSEAPTKIQAELLRLPDGTFATSADKDLSVLKVVDKKFTLPASIDASDFRNLRRHPLRAGEAVFLVGNPRGQEDSVTSGIISHVDRTSRLAPTVTLLQTDASCNPGNSGGGLYDAKGRYIGTLNSQMRSSDGLCFAIRVDSVVNWLEEIGLDMKR